MPNMEAVKVKPQADGRKHLGHVITAILTFIATLASAKILHTGTQGHRGRPGLLAAPSSRPRLWPGSARTTARTLPRATSASRSPSPCRTATGHTARRAFSSA